MPLDLAASCVRKRLPALKDKSIDEVRSFCHRFYAGVCMEEKLLGLDREIIRMRPHWSVVKRDENHRKIDLGSRVPFDIVLPFPAKDKGFAETAIGIERFRELFRCKRCGLCCSTPGAGVILEEGDIRRICEFIGSKKRLRSYCKIGADSNTWILKQPCPFYDAKAGCMIYPVRPLTCSLYPLHPPMKEMPHNLAVNAFCPAARDLAKQTLSWWAVCENNWMKILKDSSEQK
jgi:Fe-S-cluster containining protein